jgi:DNA-binding MarR family transcriptional regulator
MSGQQSVRPTASAERTAAGHAPLRTWLRLLGCSNLVEAEVRRRLRGEFAITLPRFDVLAQLDAASRDTVHGLTMSELSRRLMVTNGNLTGLVESLLEERLVTRIVSPTDRRTQIVRLTSAGKAALDAMTPAHEAWIDAMFGDLSPDDCTSLYERLGRLRGSVRAALESERS